MSGRGGDTSPRACARAHNAALGAAPPALRGRCDTLRAEGFASAPASGCALDDRGGGRAAAQDECWRACEVILGASCFTHKLTRDAGRASPTSVLSPRASLDEGRCAPSSPLSPTAHGAALGACVCAEAVARRLRHRRYGWCAPKASPLLHTR
jgi:hypothetical protein